MKIRIGVMGGTFDPPHLGHRAIASSFLHSGFIDRLLVLPTPVPPHKQDQNLTDYRHRFRMTELCFKDDEQIEVSDFEQSLPPPHYTYNTLTALSQLQADVDYKLCIGEDSLNTLQSWYQWEKLIGEFELLVAQRPNAPEAEVEIKSPRLIFVEHQPHLASSTAIREQLDAGKIPEDMLCDQIPEYIREHELYQV